MNNNEYEEFSVGNMAPVVRPDQILSKNQNTEECSDDISKGIANEFDALDMMVPGTSVTEEDEDDEEEITEATDEEKNHSATMKAIVKANKAKVAEAQRELKTCRKVAEKVRRDFKDLYGKVKYRPILRKPDYDIHGDKINSITCVIDLFVYKKGKEVDASQLSQMKKSLQSGISVTKRKLTVFDDSDDKNNKISVKVVITDVIEPQPAEVEESAVITFEESEEITGFMMEATEKIDDDIKPVISKLNNKGYKTKYSCSGHPSARFKKDKFRDGILYDKLYSSARIVFDGTYNISAPEHWEKKTLNDGKNTAIYVKAPKFKIVDGLPKDAFYKWKEKYMRALDKWADKLPKAGEESSKKDEDITESVYFDIFLDV